MATEILATGSTAASSTDVTVAAGSTDALFLKDAAGPDVLEHALALIQIKNSAGAYFTVGRLTRDRPGVIVYGPATYRVNRPGGIAFGVEKGS